MTDRDTGLETQIAQWRTYLHRRHELHRADTEELEDHLRSEIAELTGAGLHDDEAFLVAVKRMGGLDELSREFAREHSDRYGSSSCSPPPGRIGPRPAAPVPTWV